MAVSAPRRAFNVDDYYRMAEVGILSEDDRVELVEGEIVEMSPIGSRHQGCVNRLTALLTEFAARRYVVGVQGPLRLGEHSEPQPDIALLKPRDDFYSAGHPTPEDVLLLIEVSETSAGYDREVKLPLYARAGVGEVWIVDLGAQTVEVNSHPEAGFYGTATTVRRGMAAASSVVSGLSLAAEDVLV